MTEVDEATPGQRIEALRRRSGLSRERLAALAGISPTLLKFVETGRRSLTLRTAQKLAPTLGVRDLGEMFGPAVALSLDSTTSHPGVPDVARALTTWPLNATGQPDAPDYLLGKLDAAWRTWHGSRHQRTEAAAALPELITQTQRSVRLLEGNDRRRALHVMSEVYHLAQAFLAWHGDRELVWLTVDRGMSSALDADNPLSIGRSVWYAAHVLRATGRADEAMDQLRQAAGMIEPRVADADPEYAALLADLHLCTALTRARNSDRGAWVDWQAAHDVVSRALPAGYVHPWTRVGPVLVETYGVMIAVDLGDSDEARRRAYSLDPAAIPSVERRARHLVELARNADREGGHEAALHMLTQAEAISPETVQFSPAAREIIGRLVRESPAAIRADAERLAQRVNILV